MKGPKQRQSLNSISFLTLYQSFFCLYCWILFSLSLIAYENLRLLEPPKIYDSWNQHPIVDIIFQAQCSDDYVPAINYSYPKDQIRCDCSSVDRNGFQYSGVYKFNCSQQQLSQGCVMTNFYPKESISKWPSLKNGTLCYKTLLSPLNMIKRTKCQQSEIQCSTGNYQICVNQNGTCPIYSVEIIHNSGQVQFNLSMNSSNKFPISSFVIQDISNYCGHNVISTIFDPCVQIGSTYQEIDIQNSSQIYQINNINATNFVQGNYSLNTQSYNYFAFDSCSHEQFQFFQDIVGETVKLINFQKFVTIMLGGFASIYAGLIPLILCIKLVGWSVICRNLNARSQQYQDIYKFWVYSKWFFNFCCVITILISYILQSTYIGQIQDFISNKCSDIDTLFLIINYHTYFINKAHLPLVIVFFLSIITLIGHYISIKRIMSSFSFQVTSRRVSYDNSEVYNHKFNIQFIHIIRPISSTIMVQQLATKPVYSQDLIQMKSLPIIISDRSLPEDNNCIAFVNNFVASQSPKKHLIK